MIPIKEHNARMGAFMSQFFPADPGKSPRVFYFDQEQDCWLCSSKAPPPRAGFLNYNDKIEVVKQADGTSLVFRRRDMTEAEFLAMPVAD